MNKKENNEQSNAPHSGEKLTPLQSALISQAVQAGTEIVVSKTAVGDAAGGTPLPVNPFGTTTPSGKTTKVWSKADKSYVYVPDDAARDVIEKTNASLDKTSAALEPVKNYTTLTPGSTYKSPYKSKQTRREEAEYKLVAGSALPASAKTAFFNHLKALLPLRAPTRVHKDNAVIPYCVEALEWMGRTVVQDLHGNLYAEGDPMLGPSEFMEERRGIVAHTDAVGQNQGEDVEAIQFRGGVWESVNCKRPIGGDDKVGIAIALSLAAEAPWLSVVLPADEEAGCIGSNAITFPVHDLLIQNDRRGSTDLVTEIGTTEICSMTAEKSALLLLPHRDAVMGGMTDVETLVQRGLARCAFNMSCGYFNPHGVYEVIAHAIAEQALQDTWTLLYSLGPGLGEAKGFNSDQDYYYKDYYGSSYTKYGVEDSKKKVASVKAIPASSNPAWQDDAVNGYESVEEGDDETAGEIMAREDKEEYRFWAGRLDQCEEHYIDWKDSFEGSVTFKDYLQEVSPELVTLGLSYEDDMRKMYQQQQVDDALFGQASIY